MHLIPAQNWYPRARSHEQSARERSAAHVARRKAGKRNALEDFLWEYYPLRPNRFATWYPGFADGEPQVLLAPSAADFDGDLTQLAQAQAQFERRLTLPWHSEINTAEGRGVTVVDEYLDHRYNGLRHLTQLQRILTKREAVFGCLGWHEWAMVYKADETRHPLPLRLGKQRTDELVEQAHIRCTHFDAFRFFTPEATSLNHVQPSWESVPENEQPGCIHVTMDLLRACIQLGPMVPGELMIDAFDLALRARTIDMQASPYDCSSLGLPAIEIETQAGKAQYIEAQRELAQAAKPLRHRLLDVIEPIWSRLSSRTPEAIDYSR